MRAWRFPRRMSPSEPASGAPSDCRLGRVYWVAAELSWSNCVERPSQNKRLRRLNSAGGTCATRGRRKNKRCGAAGPIGRVSTRRVLCRPQALLLRAKCVGHSAAGHGADVAATETCTRVARTRPASRPRANMANAFAKGPCALCSAEWMQLASPGPLFLGRSQHRSVSMLGSPRARDARAAALATLAIWASTSGSSRSASA